MGILQHHDAVSYAHYQHIRAIRTAHFSGSQTRAHRGTEKQHVADDYAFRLARGAAAAESVVRRSLAKLMRGPSNASAPPLHFCKLLNESICEFSAGAVARSQVRFVPKYVALVRPANGLH